MIDYFETVKNDIDRIMADLFPLGAGRIDQVRGSWALKEIAQKAFSAGRIHALMGLMTANDVADHFGITPARARALIQNRNRRFGIGMKFGASWLIHQDELDSLQPEEKYRKNRKV